MVELLNKLTTLLGVQYPILSAPMATNSGGKLAGQVTAGGGFGFIGATVRPINTTAILQSEINIASGITHNKNFGVGYIAWVLDAMGSAGTDLVQTALDNQVKAVWFSFGTDDTMAKYVNFVHNDNKVNNRKTLIFAQVSTPAQAQSAVNDWKVDVINVQSTEAGGHGPATSPPLKQLLPSVKAAVPQGTLITAAGGLANGSDIANIMDLGADGATLGTRFVLAPEGFYSDTDRNFLIAANPGDTVRSIVWDEMEGVVGGFPPGFDAGPRGVKNQLVADFNKGVDEATLKARYAVAEANDDPNYYLTFAGVGVGYMSSVVPAAQLVKQLAAEATERRRHLTGPHPH